jgi:hypothetical protein
MLGRQFPKVKAMLREAEDDLLVFTLTKEMARPGPDRVHR